MIRAFFYNYSTAFVKQLNDRIFFSLTFSFLPQISKSLCPTFAKSSYCYGGDFFTSIEQIKTLTTKIVIADVSILKSDHVQKRDKKCVCENPICRFSMCKCKFAKTFHAGLISLSFEKVQISIYTLCSTLVIRPRLNSAKGYFYPKSGLSYVFVYNLMIYDHFLSTL